jgi:hypothetical protein
MGHLPIGESTVDIRQLAKIHWCIGESIVDFRQFGECPLNSRQHILWTFAIGECPVGEIRVSPLVQTMLSSRKSESTNIDREQYPLHHTTSISIQ